MCKTELALSQFFVDMWGTGINVEEPLVREGAVRGFRKSVSADSRPGWSESSGEIPKTVIRF